MIALYKFSLVLSKSLNPLRFNFFIWRQINDKKGLLSKAAVELLSLSFFKSSPPNTWVAAMTLMQPNNLDILVKLSWSIIEKLLNLIG